MITSQYQIRDPEPDQPSDRVLPFVRQIMVCDDAVIDLSDNRTKIVKRPWTVVKLAEGQSFKFMQETLWIYAQVARGVGDYRLHVEFRRRNSKPDRDGWHHFQLSKPKLIGFDPGEPQLAEEVVFKLTNVPFRTEGIYEFRIVADCGEYFQALNGPTAEFTMLDRRAVL
jgi:hypothetical protein